MTTSHLPGTNQTILIIAGEMSGDVYGAALAKQIRQHAPQTRIFSVGGDALRQESDEFLFETAYQSSIGLKSILNSFTFFKRLKKQLDTTCNTHHIDKVVIIDFQHHNFELGDFFKKKNIPIITFITPNFWLWKDLKKGKRIASYSEKIITIFEKEYEFYKSIHPKTYYFGHPFVDLVEKKTPGTSLPKDKPIISLFPGSRRQELSIVLPLMLKTLKALPDPQNYHIFLAVSNKRFSTQIESLLKEHGEGLTVTLWTQEKETLFTQSNLLICATGSVTLEAILYQSPLIIFCTLPHLTYNAAKYILRLKLDFIALPNIIAGKKVIPEWVQYDIKPDIIAAGIPDLLKKDPDYWQKTYEPVIKSMKKTDHPIENSALEILA